MLCLNFTQTAAQILSDVKSLLCCFVQMFNVIILPARSIRFSLLPCLVSSRCCNLSSKITPEQDGTDRTLCDCEGNIYLRVVSAKQVLFIPKSLLKW